MSDEQKPPTQTPRPRITGMARPAFLFAGIAYLIAAGVKYYLHQPEGPAFAACGVALLAAGWFFGRSPAN
jgi:hypothetical protein